MSNQEAVIEKETKTPSKVKDYVMLLKLRLSFLVVLSAISGFFFAGGSFGLNFLYLVIGGFSITGASNAFNQIIERDIDKLILVTPTNNIYPFIRILYLIKNI